MGKLVSCQTPAYSTVPSNPNRINKSRANFKTHKVMINFKVEL